MTGCPVDRWWAVACRPTDESQHPTDPQVRHKRRCTHVVPSTRQAPQASGGSGSTESGNDSMCEQSIPRSWRGNRPWRHPGRQDGTVHELAAVAALLLALAVAGWCRRIGRPAPLPVVVTGLLLGLLPGSEGFGANPELILSLALPPLLFAAALNSSFIGIRANRRPILLLSVGLVVFTALVVALALRLAVPGVPWSVALTLGAVLGPTDAVAASAIGGRLGLPPRILTILEGESLVNDGTGLTLFRVAVAAVVAGSMTAARATAILLLAVVGGIALGLAAGVLLRRLIRILRDPLLETTAVLLTPFVLFLGAEAVGASGFLAVVVCGLMVSHTAAAEQGFATRLQSSAIWSVVSFVLEAAAFLILGLELPHLIDTVRGGTDTSVDTSVVVLAVLLVFLGRGGEQGRLGLPGDVPAPPAVGARSARRTRRRRGAASRSSRGRACAGRCRCSQRSASPSPSTGVAHSRTATCCSSSPVSWC